MVTSSPPRASSSLQWRFVLLIRTCFGSSLGENVSAENILKTNSIDGTVPEEVMFQSEVKKLQQEQFRPAEQVSISSQEMLQYIVLE
ncbi:hypothetical protein Bca52824_064471 [Brassica carinata]|uniref:Uncharacterized protein n=1 Tax=Brassica carinata TaxID=52824 RepID=A0A8X7UBF0_BRACI|nr:hypothetical protein Bca52824_064471 [Brassica carinata]